MRKLSARWVPRLFTIDQKRIRVTTSEKNLAYYNLNSKEFKQAIIYVFSVFNVFNSKLVYTYK